MILLIRRLAETGLRKHWDKLDFVLGSVHFLDRADQMFDSVPDGAAQFEGRNIDAIYADYFRRVRDISTTGLVDCLAHLDLIKIHGHRPGGEIDSLVNETLDFIRGRNLAIELSTAGWRKPVNELYPGDRIIELAIEKGIPFTTASDAHSHAQLVISVLRLFIIGRSFLDARCRADRNGDFATHWFQKARDAGAKFTFGRCGYLCRTIMRSANSIGAIPRAITPMRNHKSSLMGGL